MKSKADEIRELVVAWNPKGEFRVQDALSSLDFSRVTESDENSSTVAAALRSWSESGFVIKGYRLMNHAEPGHTRRYTLEAAGGNGVVVPPNSAEAAVRGLGEVTRNLTRGMRRATGLPVAGDDVSVRVMEARPDGSMLVSMSGRLYVMTPLAW